MEVAKTTERERLEGQFKECPNRNMDWAKLETKELFCDVEWSL